MSASKCGNSVTFEDIEKGIKKALEPQVPLPISVSPKAYRMLQRIKKLQPDWEPTAEVEIYFKAYRLGLLEDEE